jgi:hypothetical protein
MRGKTRIKLKIMKIISTHFVKKGMCVWNPSKTPVNLNGSAEYNLHTLSVQMNAVHALPCHLLLWEERNLPLCSVL